MLTHSSSSSAAAADYISKKYFGEYSSKDLFLYHILYDDDFNEKEYFSNNEEKIGNAELTRILNTLNNAIKSEIMSGEKELLGSFKSLHLVGNSINDIVEKQSIQMNNYKSISDKVKVDLENLKGTLDDLNQHNRNLKKIKKMNAFLTIFNKLADSAPVHEKSDDSSLLRKSLFVHEADKVLRDEDMKEWMVLKDEIDQFNKIRETVTGEGLAWLEQGLEGQNQALLSKGLQIFVNLQILPQVISQIMARYQKTITELCKSTFDLPSLNLELTQQRKQGLVGAHQSPLVAFASILWARSEVLADSIYSHTSKINTLENYLSRRNDSTSKVFLLQYVQSEMEIEEGLKYHFWRVLGRKMDDELQTATKSANFLLKVLQAGYPKLLRIFSDLFSRIKLTTGDESLGDLLMTPTFRSFESAYVARSLTKLLETVTQIMQKATPNRDDAHKLARIISSELNAVKFDSSLLDLVSKNVSKSLNAFRQKLDLMIAHGTAFSITGSVPSTVQLQKIEAINCLYTLSESMWGLLHDYQGTIIEGTIVSCCESLVVLISAIVTPMFTNVVQDLSVVMCKMHKAESASPPIRTSKTSLNDNDPNATSAYMTELVAKIRWVFREFISKCYLESTSIDWAKSFAERIIHLYLLHSSITPITLEHRPRMGSDLTYLESSLTQSLSLVHSSFDSLCSSAHLKGFKRLLYMDLGDISTQLPIDSIYACNHVMTRSVIPNPVQLFSWTEKDYVDWIDTATDADCKKIVVTACDSYLAALEQAGVKETCLEHPTLRKLLLDWSS